MASASPSPPFGAPPDPGAARTLDELIIRLRLLKSWAGSPSYVAITKQVNAAWRAAGRPERDWTTSKNTVADCFVVGRRRRPTEDLLLGIIEALHPDPAYLSQWRQALRIVRGEAEAASFVQAQAALPDDLADFTGRDVELRRLAALVPSSGGSTVVISAIEGMAGIGKTRLAVHAGHQLLDRGAFDQVLFANLRGFHPDRGQPPADPAAVLASFLRLLGVPGQDIPHDLDGRAALYRERLRGRRALVVLDNAADTGQVLPLLPAGPSCLTLVTSRRTLADLPGAHRLSLDVFTPAEALEYLRHTVGADRIDADPDTAAAICEAVGHLPLALGLTAARIHTQHDWTPADHLERLGSRRAHLRLDDAIEASLDLSYDNLLPEHQHLLRMLSLHPGQDIELHAAAALAGIGQATTQPGLDQLLANHLLQQRIPGRYEPHDLVRGYASARAHDEDRIVDRRAALARLVDYYLHAACVAMDLVYPHEQHLRPRIPPPPVSTIALSDQASARGWLEAERANLLAVATAPANPDRPGSAVAFSSTLHRHLLTGGHYPDAVALHQQAITIAGQHGDRAGQAHAMNSLGVVYERIGQYNEATDCLRQALALFRDLGNRYDQACVLTDLGIVYGGIGQYTLAADHHRQALAVFRDVGDQHGQARALGNLGIVYERVGQYAQAADQFGQTLALFRDLGVRDGQARSLGNLGIVCVRLGRYAQAAEHLGQALTLFRDLGDRAGQAHALNHLGMVCGRVGQYDQAADHHRHALATFRDLGNRSGQTEALNGLGTVFERVGQHPLAADHYRQALALARELGDPCGQAEALSGLGETARVTGDLTSALTAYTAAVGEADACGRLAQARAHVGLGHVHHNLGDPDHARRHWEDALRLYTELGVPEADEVATHLAALDT